MDHKNRVKYFKTVRLLKHHTSNRHDLETSANIKWVDDRADTICDLVSTVEELHSDIPLSQSEKEKKKMSEKCAASQ